MLKSHDGSFPSKARRCRLAMAARWAEVNPPFANGSTTIFHDGPDNDIWIQGEEGETSINGDR